MTGKTALKNKDRQDAPRVPTTREVEVMIARVKAGLRLGRTDRRKEEPGLTEEARRWSYRG